MTALPSSRGLLQGLLLLSLAACSDQLTEPRPASTAPVFATSKAGVTLVYVCGNTFALQNSNDTTVAVTWSVHKTTEQDSLILPASPAGSPYSETFFMTVTLGKVDVHGPNFYIHIHVKDAVECPPVTTPRRLITIAEFGAIANPAAPDTTYADGSQVAYSFAAAPGYHDLIVTLDDRVVPASGTVIMDTNHLLRASALRDVTLPAPAVPLLQALQSAIEAPDPVPVFQAYLDLVMNTSRTLGVAVTDSLLQVVEYFVLGPSADTAALHRADSLLGGHEFKVRTPAEPTTSPGVVQPHLSLAPPTQADSAEPTAYVYVNGISTNDEMAVSTVQLLDGLVRIVGELHNGEDEVTYFYNPTRADQPESDLLRNFRCSMEAGALGDFPDDDSINRMIEICRGPAQPATEPDLVEALRQLLIIWSGVPWHLSTASQLADVIQAHRNSGQHVIVVPHSEGNQMTFQAIEKLYLDGRFRRNRDSTAIGVLSLGSPIDHTAGWAINSDYLRHVSVRGDLVADNILTSWNSMDTPLSRERDRHLSLAQAGANEAPLTYAKTAIRWGIKLHSIDESYFGQPEVRSVIGDSLVSLYRESAVGHITGGFTNYSPYPGDQRNLTSYVVPLNRNGHRIYGRRFSWHSSNPSVATVNANGVYSALTPGNAQIVAVSSVDSTVFNINVIPYPDFGFSGDWDGDWVSNTDIGTAAMSLSQNGLSITGTVTYTFRGTSYTTQVINGTISPGGANPTLRFVADAVEFGPGRVLSFALQVVNGELQGTSSTLVFGTPSGEVRSWHLTR